MRIIDGAILYNSYVHLTFSFNHGQTCCAGSRIFVQEGIYDEFLKRFTEKTRSLKVGDPFHPETFQGPQVSEVQFNVRLRLRPSASYLIRE